jgi:hypothetical protein
MTGYLVIVGGAVYGDVVGVVVVVECSGDDVAAIVFFDGLGQHCGIPWVSVLSLYRHSSKRT